MTVSVESVEYCILLVLLLFVCFLKLFSVACQCKELRYHDDY
jgi:hypothetical protein